MCLFYSAAKEWEGPGACLTTAQHDATKLTERNSSCLQLNLCTMPLKCVQTASPEDKKGSPAAQVLSLKAYSERYGLQNPPARSSEKKKKVRTWD